MPRRILTLAAATIAILLSAACSMPIELNAGPDFTDDVERAYAKAESRHLHVAPLTQTQWAEIDSASGKVRQRVEKVSAPGDQLFLPVFRAMTTDDDPYSPGFRGGITNDCFYFPVGTAPDPASTTAVARVCFEKDGRVRGTAWMAIKR
jgi:hypothetical protein